MRAVSAGGGGLAHRTAAADADAAHLQGSTGMWFCGSVRPRQTQPPCSATHVAAAHRRHSHGGHMSVTCTMHGITKAAPRAFRQQRTHNMRAANRQGVKATATATAPHPSAHPATRQRPAQAGPSCLIQAHHKAHSTAQYSKIRLQQRQCREADGRATPARMGPPGHTSSTHCCCSRSTSAHPAHAQCPMQQHQARARPHTVCVCVCDIGSAMPLPHVM